MMHPISGNYDHRPQSGLEMGNSLVHNFYRKDEVKYHGRKNRGVLLMDFFEARKSKKGFEACFHQMYKFPRKCSGGSDCSYVATWRNTQDGYLKVVVKQKYSPSQPRRWVAIGFSENNIMVCNFS